MYLQVIYLHIQSIIYTYLEDIGEISKVKDIMELDGSGQEGGSNFLVHV